MNRKAIRLERAEFATPVARLRTGLDRFRQRCGCRP